MKKLHITLPTILAMIAIVASLRAGTVGTEDDYTVVTAPTPYSNDHAVVQSRPGPPAEQPDTF